MARCRRLLTLVALLAAVGWPALSHAAVDTVATLRVMLHPYAAARGTLPAAVKARLEALAGSPLALTGTTRTGALDLALPAAVAPDAAALLARNLRNDRIVLWAEPVVPRPASAKSAVALPPEATRPGRRLMVRLADEVDADWGALLPRLQQRAGMTLTVERQVANVWILSTVAAQSPAQLANVAELIQQDPAVQYADPVRAVLARAAPNDPLYAQQWSLTDAVAGVNAQGAWSVQPDASAVTVAVVDTGILPHPDLVGRVLPGYDFITSPESARDGDARDSNPRDEGDWQGDGECDGAPAADSFFHGLFVSGLIAANTNNGVGIAGLAAGTRILPVRVLGKCGGAFDDVMAGVLWASGVNIAGVPPNVNPAKVINLSLGGYGSCSQAMQVAVDDAIAQGAVVVAAAGNETDDAANYAPGNCSGVITVGAHTRGGDRTSYTNFGRRVDLSAPGGDLPFDDLIVSLSNDGKTVPQNPSYEHAAGTSFSTPLVAGTAALMLARDATLTSGRVLSILSGTTRDFPPGSVCHQPNLCGSGMLDAGVALASTLPGNANPPPGAVTVVEYYRADLDHYFITADPAEIQFVDTALRDTFARTGLYFYAYLFPAQAPAGAAPVCRFYADATVQINSHYYTASSSECQFVLANWPGIWRLETPSAFYVRVPDAAGNCPDGTLPVYRFFNNRRDANHRYTIDLSVRRAMLNRAWVPEGNGTRAVAFCSAI